MKDQVKKKLHPKPKIVYNSKNNQTVVAIWSYNLQKMIEVFHGVNFLNSSET